MITTEDILGYLEDMQVMQAKAKKLCEQATISPKIKGTVKKNIEEKERIIKTVLNLITQHV